ncbi:MAG: hypothetical protein EHM21_11310, partial [Chloroflexi bacterium]
MTFREISSHILRLALVVMLLFLSACGSQPAQRALTPAQGETQPPRAGTSTADPRSATPVKMAEPQSPQAIETGSLASTAATETVAAPTGKPTQKPTAALMVTQGARTERLSIFHRSGQTFLTWEERGDLQGERYRVYRSAAPITAANLAQAQFLYQVGKDSARFYANYYNDPAWKPRLSDRFIFAKGALKMKEGTGALVWTLAKKDFKGQGRGKGYYAVTFASRGGREVFSVDYTAGPLEEAVRDPLPVEITYTPDIHP